MATKVNVKDILGLEKDSHAKWDIRSKVGGIYAPYPLSLLRRNSYYY